MDGGVGVFGGGADNDVAVVVGRQAAESVHVADDDVGRCGDVGHRNGKDLNGLTVKVPRLVQRISACRRSEAGADVHR